MERRTDSNKTVCEESAFCARKWSVTMRQVHHQLLLLLGSVSSSAGSFDSLVVTRLRDDHDPGNVFAAAFAKQISD